MFGINGIIGINRLSAGLIGAAVALTPVSWCMAQDEAVEAAQPEMPPTPLQTENENWTPTWSDPAFGQIASLLSGSWKSTNAVDEFRGDGATQMVVTFAPVHLEAYPDAMYVEVARAADLQRPYHQAIVQFWKRGETVRLRTLEIKDDTRTGAMTGMWVYPAFFPQWGENDLRGTLDMVFARDGNAWTARTPYAYPTNARGAVEMTSELRIAQGNLQLADRAFDAAGNQVSGPAANTLYSLQTFDHPFKGEAISEGVWRVTLLDTDEGEPLKDGDQIGLHYSGYLRDSGNPGFRFDTSTVPGREVLRFVAPGRLIAGFQAGIAKVQTGEWYQLIIRSDQAYGGSPAARGGIPQWSDLIFTIQVQYVQPPVVEEAPAPAVEGQNAEQGQAADEADGR
jgi:FKBP-type peptidyl-prolyl cis-trans isomerase